MKKVQVDLLGQGGQAKGIVANQLFDGSKINVGSLRPFIGTDGRAYTTIFKGGDPKNPSNYVTNAINTNATLRRDEWKQLDEALIGVARERLGGIQDLVDKNLTLNLGNAMGTTVFEWHDVSDSQEAIVTMDAVTRGQGDRPDFQHNYMPLPIIHVDYEINARVLAASRNLGNPLDVTAAESATRRILEKLEDMLFTNTTYSYGATDSRGRNTIYSYINHPDRNIVAFPPATGNWASATATAAGIVSDVFDLVQASIDNLHYGPWMLYIPTAYQTIIEADYNAVTPGTTIRERIMKIDGISGIKVIDHLTADNVLLVQMTSNVVRLIRGLGIQAVQWDTEGKFITKYKILTIQVPQIRSDYNGKCGIVHLS